MSPNMFKRLFCCIAADDDALPAPSIVTPANRPRPSPPTPPTRPPTSHRPHHRHSIPPNQLPRGLVSPPPPTPPAPAPPPHDKNFFKGNGSWRESDTIKRIQAGPYADDPPRPRRARLPRRASPPPPSPRKPIWLLRAEGSAERIAARAPSMSSLVTIDPEKDDLGTFPLGLRIPPPPPTMVFSGKEPRYRLPSDFSTISST